MASTTNFGWQTPDDTDLVKDGAAAIRTLGSAIDTSLVDLKGGTTGQVLSKNTNSDMDFTWVTTNDADAIQNSIVDAKGDLIAASANDTPARLAVGNNGETLVADSSATTGLRWQGNYQAGSNLVMNGNFNISQRGTSFAGVVNDYTMDRWNARNNTLGAFTVSQDTDAPAGFKTSAKWLCTTADAAPAANDFAIFRTHWEGQALQALQKGTATAKTTTLSFWVKSNLTGNYVVRLSDGDNTRSIAALYTINSSATWEKKTITFAGDTTGALDNDANNSLSLEFWLGAGSDRTSGTLNTTWAASVNANIAVGGSNLAATLNNYWMVTGVQWEIGSVATDFNLSAGNGNIAGELAACQRYYWRNTTGSTNGVVASGISTATGFAQVVVQNPTQMRIEPTAVEFADLRVTDFVGINSAVTALTIVSADSGPLQVSLSANVGSGLTQFRPAFLTASSATGYIALSAEL